MLTDKTLKSKSHKGKTLMSLKDENENGKTSMSSKDDDDDDDDDDDENENDNENDNNIMRQLNDNLDEIIDKSKSFEDQIKSIRKVENLKEYWFINDYGNKELECKIY